MKLRCASLLGVLVLFLGMTAPVGAGENTYAAVAFSPSTGRYGFGNGCRTEYQAVEKARQECGASDAITKWCRNSWIALAVSKETPGGYGWAWGATAAAAESAAKRNCRAT